MLLLFILLFTVAAVSSDPYDISSPKTPEDTSLASSDTTQISITTDGAENDVEYNILENIFFNTSLGYTHHVTIPRYDLYIDTKCNLVKLDDGSSTPVSTLRSGPFKPINSIEIACGVLADPITTDAIGKWRLEYGATRYGENIEIWLPFEVYVEVSVETAANVVTLVEDNNFYFRLKDNTSMSHTCVPIPPPGLARAIYMDPRYPDSCGFVVNNITTADSGLWEIRYGFQHDIIYRAFVQLNVLAKHEYHQPPLFWTRDKSVNITIGPEDAVYCTVISSDGFVVYDSFGRCKISLVRVTPLQRGIWRMLVAFPGRVITEEIVFRVELQDAVPKPEVVMNVNYQQPVITISCKVSSPYPIRACKFRKPSGQVLIATEGIGESKYTFHGKGVSYESGMHTHDCGLQITDPLTSDLGIWRCALETELESYFGFMKVLFPWGVRDPEVLAQVVTEPVLKPDRYVIHGVDGDALTLSCSVQSPIRYCYFRSNNGTVYNVGPDQPHDHATYVGAGFDAGECGIRFPSYTRSETDTWYCHVGFTQAGRPEQQALISVYVEEEMVSSQRFVMKELHVEAQVKGGRQLEYCRYVRADGLGFIGDFSNMPPGYFNIQNLLSGRCGISISNPSEIDHRNWTIVAKIQGRMDELVVVTSGTFENPIDRPPQTVVTRVSFFWIFMLVIACSIFMVALIGPKNNRRWTYDRANAVRTSFRTTFARKPPVLEPTNNNVNTALAA